MTEEVEKRSFTDQKRRIATEEDCKASWGGAKNGKNFRCSLCGYHFKVGDGWRWVYAAGRTFVTGSGHKRGIMNIMVCDDCDGDDVLDRWVDRCTEFYSGKFWGLRN